jgi:hypothetical protein
MQKSIKILLFVLLVFFVAEKVSAQKIYDIYTDTLLIINGKPIDKDRILIKRKEILEADTFKVNQRGLTIMEFTMSAITLGKKVELKSNKPVLTSGMKNEILNKQANFKFIYLKNIILQTKDGRLVGLSTKQIKIIFED